MNALYKGLIVSGVLALIAFYPSPHDDRRRPDDADGIAVSAMNLYGARHRSAWC